LSGRHLGGNAPRAEIRSRQNGSAPSLQGSFFLTNFRDSRTPLSAPRGRILRLAALLFLLAALSTLAASERAYAFPLSTKDTPNDGGGSIDLTWTPPVPHPAHWIVVRREQDGTFAPVATVDGTDTRYSDDSVQDGTAYQYQLVASPADPALDSEVSGPARASVNFFDWSKFNVLVVAGIFFVLLFWYIRLSERGVTWVFRKIPGLAAIEEAVGRATEMGKGVLYVPGVQEIDDIQTIASMILLGRVARICAKYETALNVPANSPGVYTVAEEVVKSAYADVGRADAYRSEQVRYVTSEQFAYVAAVNGMMLRERPAANLLLGAFFAESLLLAETGHAVGAIQIAGTANVHQMPFFVVACDYTLIGEEYFAASALLSNDARLLGSLKATDSVKILMIIVIVLGSIMATFGQTWLGDFFATQ